MRMLKISRVHKYLASIVMMTFFLYWGSEVPTATAIEGKSSLPKIMLNSKPLSFDVPPMIENGRIMVPLRAIFEAMGAKVDWDATTMTVTAVKVNNAVVLEIGSLTPTVNGLVFPIDVPAEIVNGRTLAPLRFVCEAFGANVIWAEDTQTAYMKTFFMDFSMYDIVDPDKVLDKEADDIIAKIVTPGMNDLQKETVIYNYLVHNTKYGNGSLYDTLMYGVGDCVSQSRAAKLLLDKAGIECMMIDGTAGFGSSGHTWNIVKINGHYYHLDVQGRVFNFTDDEASNRGYVWTNSRYPACNG